MEILRDNFLKKIKSRKFIFRSFWVCAFLGIGVLSPSVLWGGLEDRDEKEETQKETTKNPESSLEKQADKTENKNQQELQDKKSPQRSIPGAKSLKNKWSGASSQMSAAGAKLKGKAKAMYNKLKDGAALKAAAGALGGVAAAAAALALMKGMKEKVSSALCYGGCSKIACQKSARVYNICMSRCPASTRKKCEEGREESHPNETL
jgi:hypothetical protein